MSWRVFVLAFLGVASSFYALVRYYTRTEPPAPSEREIPAPEVVPLER
jgi:hypothetical protein